MGKTKVKLEDIIQSKSNMDYVQIYNYICNEIKAERLIPIKTSKLNGKKPALYNSCWNIQAEKDYAEIYNEI